LTAGNTTISGNLSVSGNTVISGDSEISGAAAIKKTLEVDKMITSKGGIIANNGPIQLNATSQSIIQDSTASFYIADSAGRVIAQIDQYGLKTTDISANTLTILENTILNQLTANSLSVTS
jgi:hypothetical protein